MTHRTLFKLYLTMFWMIFAVTTNALGDGPAGATTKPTTRPVPQLADIAAPKIGKDGMPQAAFIKMHESFLKRAKAGEIGVLFLGDSITQGWSGNGKEVWAKTYSNYDPANFGIGGDQTQHVLWRMDNGELDGISPKVVVLMIGTNNIGYRAEDIVRADTKIVRELHQKLPDTKVLLLGIFPRAHLSTDVARAKIKIVNGELAKLDDGKSTRYLDIGDKFLDQDGMLNKDIMPDFLHPNAKGYQIWADAMQSLLDEMMK